ncbi:MAG: phage major capsid protein [Phycisphaerae bacterium]|nr:phage major capsid protein [Phycisphaerae bacterium]
MDPEELRKKRAELLVENDKLLKLAEGEDRDFTEDEEKAFNERREKITSYETRLTRIDKHAEDEAREMPGLITQPVRPPVNPDPELRSAPEQTQRQTPVPRLSRTPYASLRHYSRYGEQGYEMAHAAGMFFRAALFGHREARDWCEKHGVELRTAQNESVGYQGGYLVPTEVGTTIIDLKEERGVFAREAYSWPMASDTATIPRRATGLTAYAVGESDAITESNMTWDQVVLAAKKWAALTKISSELAEDATANIGDLITGEIAYAFADKEDECGFNGDGTSTYHGIHGATVKINDGNHAAGLVTSAEQKPADIIMSEFENMMGICPSYAEANAKWYFSKVWYMMSGGRLQDAAGGQTVDHLARGPQRMFLGYPVVYSQVLSTTITDQTSTIVGLFGDLNLAATRGVRRQMTVKTLTELYAANDQIGIVATTRFDVNVHDLGDGTNAGPLIALKTASS